MRMWYAIKKRSSQIHITIISCVTNVIIVIIAVFGTGLLQSDWVAGTLHDHAQDLSQQQILAGSLSKLAKG